MVSMLAPRSLALMALLFVPGAWAKQSNKPGFAGTATLDADPPEQQPILVVHITINRDTPCAFPNRRCFANRLQERSRFRSNFPPRIPSGQAQPVDCGLE